jgi:hypothetical protein
MSSVSSATKEDDIMGAFSRTWAVLMTAAGALTLAAGVAAQGTQTKETVPDAPASEMTVQVKGQLVAKGSNWLIAKDSVGGFKVYSVQPGRKAIVDGVPKTLDQLELGTMLTSTATTTVTPVINRTTTITKGTVFWASPTSVIVTLESGENKQYEVPEGFKFNVDGKEVSAMDLRRGMKITGTRIVEEPATVITQDVVVTGTVPK